MSAACRGWREHATTRGAPDVATVVVPFAGVQGKTRLHESARVRRVVSLAMLADVLAVCVPFGRTLVVTPDADAAAAARKAGAEAAADPGGGQGAAVRVGLEQVGSGPALVVNSDLPCLALDDLEALAGVVPAHGLALVEAADGTTNALGLSAPAVFAPLYGPGSAGRFREHAARLGLAAAAVELPGVTEDVDTLADLERLEARCGAHTRACLARLAAGACA